MNKRDFDMGNSHIASIAIHRHAHFPAMAQSAILSIPAVVAAIIPTIFDMGNSHIAYAGIIAGTSRIPLRAFSTGRAYSDSQFLRSGFTQSRITG